MSLLPALLTAFFFALSAFFASRGARMLGGTIASYVRLLIAFVILAVYAHTFGMAWQGPGLNTLLLSGAIGLGVGDAASFQALKRINPGLSLLIVQCLCAPIAAVVEWVWLGTLLTPNQVIGIAVILGGMAVALIPRVRIGDDRRNLTVGTLFAAAAALMQAIGAVLTRDANALNATVGISIDGVTSAYQRMCGAVVAMTIIFLLVHYGKRRNGKRSLEAHPPRPWAKAMPWVTGNALVGLVFGIACFQWALASLPSTIALSIVATSPLIAMPLSWLIEGERPRLISVVGGMIAVGGIVMLKFM